MKTVSNVVLEDYNDLLKLNDISKDLFSSFINNDKINMFKILDDNNIIAFIRYDIIAILNEFKLCDLYIYNDDESIFNELYTILEHAIIEEHVLKLVYKGKIVNSIVNDLKNLGFVVDKQNFKLTKPLFLANKENLWQ